MQRGVGRGLAATKPAWMTSGSVAPSLGGLNGRGGPASSSHGNGSRQQQQSRSRSRSRIGRRSGGGGGRERSRRRSDSRDRRSRSRSRHRSDDRRNGGGRDTAARSGGRSNANDVASRAVQQAFAGGGGGNVPAAGRGRGRGSTIPAWMTHPGGPGGLQESDRGDRGDGRPSKDKSPPRFARSAGPLPPEPTMANGGITGGRGGGGRGWSRSGGGHYGSGGGGGGRGGGRGPEKLPEVFSVHKGEVVKTETFGAFIKLDGYRKHGLVHCSQMASYRVEDVTDVCKVGDTVYAKVIEVTDGADPREQRIALSMKLVNQADGKDLDPSNAEAETDAQRKRPAGGGDRAPVQLEAVFNTTCTKCGVHGHLSIDCFSRGGKKYELVDEEDPRDNGRGGAGGGTGNGMRGVHREPPHGGGALAGGRGRGATMPAWMNDLGLVDKLNKKSHRKEKKSKKKKKSDHRRGDSDSDSSDDDDDDDHRKKHKKSGHKHKKSDHKHKKSGHKHKKSKHSSGNRDGRRGYSDSGSDDSGGGGGGGDRGRVSSNGMGGGTRGSWRDENGSMRRQSRSSDNNGRGGGGRRGRSRSRQRGEGGGWGGRRGRSDSRRGGGGRYRADDRGRFDDAPLREAAGVGDGGRWKPRGDSDRSHSR
ncbi:conserved unknown protein [Ectocarpus siliculosus]|uniref:S1 motif domain-containing protein n=1 Tax=Ectocarpus siliculosus TaxID=2880 RepID=D8LRA9_ECTSI|nr:conserved unknown protein [Ectocarpus siliculosus]|eukprot:CBN75014.1 conserved unknown protein [Ectocarpus siliculosus]